MYTLLWILGAVACGYLLVGSIVVFRRQQRRDAELDKDASRATVRHPIAANPILLAYLLIPVATILIAILYLYFTGT